MPLKILFVLTISVALACVVSRYIGWRYPLSATSGATLDPDLSLVVVYIAEVAWTVCNIYALHLLHQSWRIPVGIARISIAALICMLFYAQYFLGSLALRDLDEFRRNVQGPWSN